MIVDDFISTHRPAGTAGDAAQCQLDSTKPCPGGRRGVGNTVYGGLDFEPGFGRRGSGRAHLDARSMEGISKFDVGHDDAPVGCPGRMAEWRQPFALAPGLNG